MKIELQYPFSEDWKLGYLRYSKSDGRGRVDLFNNDRDRTTISHARYLMSVHLGRYLTENEEVDHINRDVTDDRIENLQVLCRKDHHEKTGKENRLLAKKFKVKRCPCCNKAFKTRKYNKTQYKNSFCSRSCNGTYQKGKLKNKFYKSQK